VAANLRLDGDIQRGFVAERLARFKPLVGAMAAHTAGRFEDTLAADTTVDGILVAVVADDLLVGTANLRIAEVACAGISVVAIYRRGEAPLRKYAFRVGAEGGITDLGGTSIPVKLSAIGIARVLLAVSTDGADELSVFFLAARTDIIEQNARAGRAGEASTSVLSARVFREATVGYRLTPERNTESAQKHQDTDR